MLKSILLTVMTVFGMKAYANVDVWQWSDKNPVQLGCEFAKKYGYKHAKFNCKTKDYKNEGDPCDKTKLYYEGPQFPSTQKAKIHPDLKAIQLFWEHGQLQSIDISLHKEHSFAELQKTFPKLTADQIKMGENPKTTDFTVKFFEHVGAEQVKCQPVPAGQ